MNSAMNSTSNEEKMNKLLMMLLTLALILPVDLFGQRGNGDSNDQYETFKIGLSDMVVMLFHITASQVADSIKVKGSISAETPAVKEMIAFVDTIVNPVRPMSKQDLLPALRHASDALKQIIKSNKRPREDAEIAAFDKISELILKVYGDGVETNESTPVTREYTFWETVFMLYVVLIGAFIIGLIAFLRFEILKHFRKVIAFVAVSTGVVDHGSNNETERMK